jgi:hypothetical protein
VAASVPTAGEQRTIVEADGEIPYIETHHLEMDILPKRLPVFV